MDNKNNKPEDWIKQIREQIRPSNNLKILEESCIFDLLSDEEKRKPLCLYCPCPKCNPRCY